MKSLTWVLAAFLLAVLAVLAWRNMQSQEVRVAVVSRGDILVGYDEDGYVRSDVEAVVASRLAGRVAHLDVLDGARVSPGQLLARLDATELEASIAAAAAEVQRARAMLARAREALHAEQQLAASLQRESEAALGGAQKRHQVLLAGARARELERARAQLAQAEAAAAEARRAAARVRELCDQGYSTPHDLDAAESQATQLAQRVVEARAALRLLAEGPTSDERAASGAGVQQAEAQVAAARARVLQAAGAAHDVLAQQAALEGTTARLRQLESQRADTVLRAARGGLLAWQDVSVGDVVPAGRVLARIVDPGRIYVEALIDERDSPGVHAGQQVRVTAEAFGDTIFGGSILAVQGEAVLKRKNIAESGREDDRAFKARVRVDDPERRLRPGMSVYVQVVTGAAHDVLEVPREALSPRAADWDVWVVEGGKAQPRPVRIGARDARSVELREGLRLGEQVVISGHEVLTPGCRVRVRP